MTDKPSKFSLTQMDSVAWLRTLPDESVDLCVTDYAYESLEKHRSKGTTTRLKVSDGSSNEWFEIFRNHRVPELLSEIFRVLKKNSHLYMISDQETMIDVVRPMGREAGFVFWKSLSWVKVCGKDDGEVIDPEKELSEDDVKIGMGYHWRNSKEEISFLEKGKRKLNYLGWPDVLPAPRVDKAYPTEKPVSLLRTLIENSSNPGDLVIDPFMGSASCGEAALKSGRSFAGCDISPKSLEVAKERLAPLGEIFTLPKRGGVWEEVVTPQVVSAPTSLGGLLGFDEEE